MTRTKKNRIVENRPPEGVFFCRGCDRRGEVSLSLEEYEAIRLLDREGLSQEEASFRMGIARTTLTAIYARSREKIAEFLTGGKKLVIDGGSFTLQEGKKTFSLAQLEAIRKGKKDQNMLVAVAYENGEVYPHFGRSEHFKLYQIEDEKIASSEVLSTDGASHSLLVEWLADHHVDTVICGGVGGGAVNFLAEAGISLIAGVSGDADAAVAALLKGDLQGVGDATCQHEENGENGCRCQDGCHCHD